MGGGKGGGYIIYYIIYREEKGYRGPEGLSINGFCR